MANDLTAIFGNEFKLPAHLMNREVFAPMPVFETVDRLSIKNSKFRVIVDGVETPLKKASGEGYLEVIIVAMHNSGSRKYFPSFDEDNNSPPVCIAPDGKKPVAELSPDIQSNACATCPMNQRDSKGNKPCSFFYRTIVIPIINGKIFNRPLRYDASGSSFLHEETTVDINDRVYPSYGLKDYAAKLAAKGVHISFLHTYIVIDDDASVPITSFTPTGQFTTDDEMVVVEDNKEKIMEVLGFGVDVSGERVEEEITEAKPATKAQPKAQAKSKARSKAQAKPKTQPESQVEEVPFGEDNEVDGESGLTEAIETIDSNEEDEELRGLLMG